MADLDEPFDPAEVAEAEALDRQIESVLAGRAGPEVSPAVSWMVAATRVDPPPALAARVEDRRERELDRRWRPARYLAGAMAYLLLSQGLGGFFIGDWVADGVGEAYSPHVNRELSFALIGAGIAVLAGALRRRWMPVAVAAGTPLGVALGVHGVTEIGVFAPGAVLHLSQGGVALALAFAYWRFRRDTSARDDE